MGWMKPLRNCTQPLRTEVLRSGLRALTKLLKHHNCLPSTSPALKWFLKTHKLLKQIKHTNSKWLQKGMNSCLLKVIKDWIPMMSQEQVYESETRVGEGTKPVTNPVSTGGWHGNESALEATNRDTYKQLLHALPHTWRRLEEKRKRTKHSSRRGCSSDGCEVRRKENNLVGGRVLSTQWACVEYLSNWCSIKINPYNVKTNQWRKDQT